MDPKPHMLWRAHFCVSPHETSCRLVDPKTSCLLMDPWSQIFWWTRRVHQKTWVPFRVLLQYSLFWSMGPPVNESSFKSRAAYNGVHTVLIGRTTFVRFISHEQIKLSKFNKSTKIWRKPHSLKNIYFSCLCKKTSFIKKYLLLLPL